METMIHSLCYWAFIPVMVGGFSIIAYWAYLGRVDEDRANEDNDYHNDIIH